jgi:hypothetical protein
MSFLSAHPACIAAGCVENLCGHVANRFFTQLAFGMTSGNVHGRSVRKSGFVLKLGSWENAVRIVVGESQVLRGQRDALELRREASQ